MATRFQILVEIAHSGPNVQQRDVAGKLGISPQAVSDYVKQLVDEGLLGVYGRSRYRVTEEGTNWIIKVLRELKDYGGFIEKTVTNMSICAAIAESDLAKGQVVGIKMKEGLLYATGSPGAGAKGISFSDAKSGEAVGVTKIEGIVELTRGKITLLNIPTIEKGGAKRIDYRRLKSHVDMHPQVGSIGIEALSALRKLGGEPRYKYGVVGAAIEAAKCGLPFLIVCASDAINSVLSQLAEEGIEHELIDLDKSGRT